MKKGWEEISVGDVITIKRKDKFICVFASDVPAYPITKGEVIEVVDFFSNPGNSMTSDRFKSMESQR